ncbi:ABC transporter permease [Thermodesulfobacteriota bacterium]
MELLKIIVRNVFRHGLRSGLTILGVAVAILAFCILRTLVGAWYAGVDFAAANRLVTRNKTSLIYKLPMAYENRIRQVAGVTGVGRGIWFGGIYKDKKNFFAQFAVSGIEYLDLYPEFLLTEQEKKQFELERNACIVGRKLANRYGWKLGDIIPLKGTIYPGTIELTLRGIYRGTRRTVDETAFFFRWDYLNERLEKNSPELANKAGWFICRVGDPDRAAEISHSIDKLFENSLAETLTETEKAFQLGFVGMTEAIVAAIRIISVVVIGIILIVLGNTMAMTARERTSEYAVLKTLGFGRWTIFSLIAGESVSLALVGGVIGAVASLPGVRVFQKQLENYLPVFEMDPLTPLLVILLALSVGLAAALPPAVRVMRMSIAEGLSHMG